ncbi:hypothetical protein DPMN_148430 [Dreissena polymorpha]|uniref:Uncharacterized protein n=1 Tax=Dreissena polymorpha TaxID=45954 RepID=A0A9D4FAV2_DREPO|nr:hypothetical protein DPMN_148430 [Dreissena polymorpha]
MSYYRALLFIATLLLICNHAYAAAFSSSIFSNIASLVLDAFDLGKWIYDATSTSATESAKKEILNKIGILQSSVDELHQTVKDLFFQLQLQLALQKVDDFDRSTTNRLRDAQNIISAKSTEKATYYGFFENGIGDYLNELYAILPYVSKRSLSLEQSPLEMMRQKTNCDITKMQKFSAFVHNLVLSGISIEIIHKKKKLPTITLATEKAYWEQELKAFDAAVAVQNRTCINNFESLYLEDIKQINKTHGSLLATLESRYPDKLHVLLWLNGNQIKVSNTLASNFKCVEPTSGVACYATCFIYYKNDMSCDRMVAIRILKLGSKTTYHWMSNGTMQWYDSVKGLQYYRPSNCPIWQASMATASPSSKQMVYVKCGSSKSSSDKLIAFLALMVVALAC